MILTLWAWLKKIGAWLAARPMFALIGGLALSLMAALAGGRWKDRKLAHAEAQVQKARVDKELEPGRVETAVIEDRLVAEEKRAVDAHGRGEGAAARQNEIEKESHERAKRWPTK